MKFSQALLASVLVQGAVGVVLGARDAKPVGGAVEALAPKNFKDLGAKRVKITYGPYLVPGSMDAATHGMELFQEPVMLMPCHDCLITAYQPNLIFEDGTTANANKGMWLHHVGISNMNRTDAACEAFPERIVATGNERESFDLTLAGARKAGYYVGKNDILFLATDVMNESEIARAVYLTVEWEFMPSVPAEFDLAIPVWLDVIGNCLDQPQSFEKGVMAFNVSTKTGWSPSFSDGDLYRLSGHVHDGNVGQEVYLNGKRICENVPAYGETEGFITHVGMYGHEMEGGQTGEPDHDHHDGGGGDDDDDDDDDDGHEEGSEHHHDSSGHIYHISSMTACTNIGKIGPADKLTLTSSYNMTAHPFMSAPGGAGLEPVMGIEFMHVARPQKAAMMDIMMGKQPNLAYFIERVGQNPGVMVGM